jgi:hypothetical protein
MIADGLVGGLGRVTAFIFAGQALRLALLHRG